MKYVLVLSVLFSFSLFGRSHVNPLPTDSSTSLIKRTAALLLIEEGKNKFFAGKYQNSLRDFIAAGIKDKYNHLVYFWQGKCHFEMDNYGEAYELVLKAEGMSKEEHLDVVILKAFCLHRLEKIDEAKKLYEYLATKLPKTRMNDLRIEVMIASCDYILEQQKAGKSNKRKVLSQAVNSEFSDYAPILIDGGKKLYFTSRRENTTGGMSNPDDGQYFEDNYVVVWNEQTKDWDSLSNDMYRLNSNGFDCISWLSPDGLNGLMTVNNTAIDDAEKPTMSSDIFEIVLSNKGKWQTPKMIKNKSINTSFFDGAATMTADGNRMYFVSDRKGDKSMTDIYMVERSGRKWGEAVPVSDSINTPYMETTPFITPDGRYLFFSSTGHPGMGGYDIFVSENLGNTWSKPVNLGIEINTVNDDTHFQYYAKLKKALYAGISLDELRGNIDIFELDMKQIKLPIEE
ncbi:MAG: hypothetical protein EP338_11635 [Bacteroidetes bacterium]|nr:MAG: hypothetical protein EP338_11635 [Bacteroidota bacterium]